MGWRTGNLEILGRGLVSVVCLGYLFLAFLGWGPGQSASKYPHALMIYDSLNPHLIAKYISPLCFHIVVASYVRSWSQNSLLTDQKSEAFSLYIWVWTIVRCESGL